MREVALWRRLCAEFLGSAFLAMLVIGSGIAAQQLSPGNTGLQLLENAAATGAGLFAIILMFGAVSGAHFNPIVSFVDAAFGGLALARRRRLPAGPGGRLRSRRHRGQRHVLPGGHRALHQAPRLAGPLPLRGHRHPRAHARDLRPGPLRTVPQHARRGRRLHRSCVLLHQLDQLRQPGHHRRTLAEQHLRRDRALVGSELRRGPGPRWAGRRGSDLGPLPVDHE